MRRVIMSVDVTEEKFQKDIEQKGKTIEEVIESIEKDMKEDEGVLDAKVTIETIKS